MQFSNDNFDELLNKAAEDYPLKTGTGNWDTVAVQLRESAVAARTKTTRKWGYASVLLLLLLGGGFFVMHYTGRNASSSAGVVKDQIQKTSPANGAGAQQNIDKAAANSNIVASSSPDKSVDHSLKHLNTISFAAPDKAISTTNDKGQIGATQPAQSNIDQSNQKNAPVQEKQNTVANNGKSIASNNNNSNRAVAENNTESKTSDIPIKLHPASKTLYGTLFVAPQLSSVKSQQVDKIGYKIGISLGYRINDRFNVEIAVQRESKNFYSLGEYFDRSNLKLKETTSIETLSGNAKLTDIPVSIRYNFHSRGAAHFFASAGVSAILITHSEKYDYEVTKDGTPDNVSKHFGASTEAKYFSGFNTSVGYEAPLGNMVRFKVEPYYQANLKGLGIGNLPVNSFGISVGISKDLK